MARTDRRPRRGPDRVLAWLARIFAFLTAPFVRYELLGGRSAADLRVGVIAVNHRSMFDIIAGLICLHRFGHYPRLLVERRYVESGIVGRLSQAIGAIPVDRTGDRGKALAAAWQGLDDGLPILVMPEGNLHWDPDDPLSTGTPHTGVSRLATHAGHPVVPVGLAGTERVMASTDRLPRFNPFRRKVVVCHVADDPLYLEGEDHAANAEQVMAVIRDLLAEAQPLVR